MIRSLRPFVGSRDFDASRAFYRDFGFRETPIDGTMSLFTRETFIFYLQRYFVREWVDNTMLFLEVDDLDAFAQELELLDLPGRHAGVRVSGIQQEYWGRELFVHDPAGVLWHVGEFAG